MSSLNKWLTVETFHDVRDYIIKLAHKFHLKHGGDIEELIAEAVYWFIIAGRDYREGASKMTFNSYMGVRIWNGLIDSQKRRWRHPEKYIEELIVEKVLEIPTYSNRSIQFLTDLFDAIGQDARMVATSILEPDDKLVRILRRTEGVRIERRALRRYLTSHHKWSDDRVDDAFFDLIRGLKFRV